MWPALDLSGYEIYKLYIETVAVNPTARMPIGLAQDNLYVWYSIF
jgi:hypothetical protein